MLDSAAVQNNDRTPSSLRPASTLARVIWLVLVLAALYMCYFHNLGALGLVGPDEPRYAWVARGMVETGDWITPRLYGQPWFEKPVLYFWGTALAFKLFGVSEAAARLPSAISALLATLTLAWLAWRIYGAATARILAVMLPTTAALIAFSHAAAPDMPFASMLTVAMVAAGVVVGLTKARDDTAPGTRNSKVPITALAAFGAFLGAATLAKGPAAIVIAGGATGLWAFATKRWRDALRLAHPIAIATFAVTALPWYVLCTWRNPDFFRVFILEHNFARFLTPVFQHVQPFWFFAPVIALGLLPWTLVLALVSRDALRSWRARSWSRSPLWFLGCWAVFPIIFFSLSKSKLPGYVLPSFPPLIVLCSRSIILSASNSRRRANWFAFFSAGIFLALGIGARLLQSGSAGATHLPALPWTTQFIDSAIVGGIAIACLGLWTSADTSMIGSVLTVLVLLGILGRGLPDLDHIYFSRDAANFATSAYPALASENAFVYRIPRAHHYSLNFYLHRELPEWTFQKKNPALVFTPLKEQPALRDSGFSCDGKNYGVSKMLTVCVRP